MLIIMYKKAMNKPFFRSRTVKVFYYPNGHFMALWRNAFIVGCLHPNNRNNNTRKLLLALSANKPFRKCKGNDALTITILDDEHYEDLRNVARYNFPSAHIN